MKKIVRKILFIGCLFPLGLVGAPPHIVTFFASPYPQGNSNTIENHNQGIFFTYFGYKTVSDSNGQVTFPLKTQKPSMYLLVANNVEPVFMLHNTIHHWELKNSSKYSFFSIERKYDEKTKLYFWSVEQVTMPKDLEIPLNTIIVHASPESVYVPTGITLTTDNAQLVLPQIYIKSKIQLSHNALQFLENCEFFAPIDRSFKVAKETQESMV